MTIGVLLSVCPVISMASPARRTPVVEAVEKVMPCVVNIGTERPVQVSYSDPSRRFRGDLFDRFFEEYFHQRTLHPGYRTAHSLGSGVLVDEQGYILTNYHVIERASRIQVTLADEESYDAVVVSGDDINDLALIKIEADHPLPAVTFAASHDVLLGETVVSLGNPFGLEHTVTVGVLSAFDREATYQGRVLFSDILQTDAAVNPGSSGGPLVNVDGELMGINVAIYKDAQNIGFAIPVSRARDLLKEWLAPERLHKLGMGCVWRELEGGGLTVDSVTPDGPAARAGLRVGDFLLSVKEVAVEDLLDVNKVLLEQEADTPFSIEVNRAGERIKLTSCLEKISTPSGAELASNLFGLELVPSGDWAMANIKSGVLVKSVLPNRPAEEAGLKPGGLLTSINGREIQTLEDVAGALENARPGEMFELLVLRLRDAGTHIVASRERLALKVPSSL